MKYYIRQIKPYIAPPSLQGFNDRPFSVDGYDWMAEDLEEELRDVIIVKDPWSKLIFVERYVEIPSAETTIVRHAKRGLHVGDRYYCSACNRLVHCANYCENCGAKIIKEN